MFSIIFGLVDLVLCVLVGLLGSRRRIGFGWSFLISLVISPLIGLIVTVCFPKLPNKERKWGCLGSIIGFIVIVAIIALVLYLVPSLFEQAQSWFQSL